ncbi:hypothetical protein [Noviherbaspirillum pedocola]|uniref:Uncharacterized protein n=1 Tax=Noviherbaspirillum pedocola TaxID=2801341 RepID=A0A934ST14_9BURK|nr:hypothetical protein [Noviherbaspirillum pedocola]MBK4734989.1 hypothetical protein [Noviherbaspirillum pedocola]
MTMHKRILAAGALLLAAAALGGCGGGSDDGSGGSQASNPGASDAFFARVLALISTSADNAEPIAIDDIAVTTPNDIEPAPL